MSKIAIIEEVAIKSSGRISLTVRCPFCQSHHFHDLGFINKDYHYPCSIRYSTCGSNIQIPYSPIIRKDAYPSLVIQYYSSYITPKDLEDCLRYTIEKRVKFI